jgi:RNA 3'-terminal phosphate cyclase (ATP)
LLRTALSLSLATGQAFRIENIRAKREKPGLLRQHLTAVQAAAEIGNAKTEGATLNSMALTFSPGKIRAGEYHFAVGTAGSGTLVFQTILPALMTASGPSRLVIEGGTHNLQAPPFDFLAKTFLPLLGKMGPNVKVKLERYGFYPAGGGRFTAEIEPCEKLSSIELKERGEITRRHAVAIVANLARRIAEREIETMKRFLGWEPECFEIVSSKDSAGPGNVAMIEIGCTAVAEVFTGFGRIGASAEHVASEAAGQAKAYLASGAVADEHLTDQLLLPIALAGHGSFTGMEISLHAQTNMDVIAMFLPAVHIQTEKSDDFVEVSL